MKKITQVLIIFLVTCCIWQSNAQFVDCGQPDLTPEDAAQLLLDLQPINFGPSGDAIMPVGSIVIPLQAHIVRTNAGTGGADPTIVMANIIAAQAKYSPYDISYNILPINYIDVTALLDLGTPGVGGSGYTEGDNVLQLNNVPNVVNLYFVNSAVGSSGGYIGGYARFPWLLPNDYFVVVNGNLEPNGATVAHEMGHYFGLLHTFEPFYGNEFVNGTNCGVAGDLLCDTPADGYNFYGDVNSGTCAYSSGTDPNGDAYVADPTQIMSYNQPFSCVLNFSSEAETRMRFYMGNDFPDTRSYLFAPTAVCTNYTAVLDPMGNATITGANVDGGSTDPNGGPLTLSVSPSNFSCANIGPNTVTLTVTDSNGFTDTCTATVTVEDNIDPVITCAPDGTRDTDPGVCQYTVVGTEFDATFTDNCMDGSITNDLNGTDTIAGEILPKGDTTVIWTVDDGNGQTASCTTVITVEDNEDPVVVCQNIILELDSNGMASISLSTDTLKITEADPNSPDTIEIQNFSTSSENYSGYVVVISDSYSNINIANTQLWNLGTMAAGEVLFKTDGVTNPWGNNMFWNNSSNSWAMIIDDTGKVVDAIFWGWTEAEILAFNTTINGFPITITSNEWSGDGTGANCTQSRVRQGTSDLNTAADWVCGATTLGSMNPGLSITPGTGIIDSVSDNCGIDTITLSQTDFTCADLGANTVTVTVTDVNGNVATCISIVTVEDNIDPVITCAPDGTRDADPGVCQYTVVGTEFDATFTDNCLSSIITNDFDGNSTLAGAAIPKGVNTITWTVDDGNGQTASCTTVITVEDNEDPVITCAPNGTRDADPGVCQYTVVGTEFDATFTDNCMSAVITNDLNGLDTIAGEILPKGVTTVVWTVDDGNGQTATCTTVITVEDNEDPVITCAANGTRDTDPGLCQYTVVGTEFDATFTDNCPDGSITNDMNGTDTVAGEILVPGVYTVVWIVDDGNGQTATCTTVITVEDNEDPLIACPVDVAVNTDPGQCSTVVIFPDAIAIDNCGVASVIQTAGLPSGSMFPVGVSTVEYTATDIHGNTSVCSFTITVTDNEPAMAVCQDITIELDANGNAMIVASDVDGGSTDNCGVAGISIDIDTFDCSDVGLNDVTLTVTDVNGNVSTCIAVVTVEDVTDPDVLCMDITVQLDATGTVTIAGIDVDGGSTDACGIASYELDIDTFDCSNVGPNTVILTVTDVNGNVSTCTAVVTVEDNISPDLVCMDITVELDENGEATIVPEDVMANNTDACGILTTGIDIFQFNCDDIGTPVTVTVFSQDVNGNLSSCMAVVTVVDLLAPVVTCPADITVDPGPGNLFYEVPDYFATGEATATDNCTDPLILLSQDPAAGTLLSDGVYTVTMTAEDEYGNIGTCTFELTIESLLGIGDQELSMGSISIYPNPATEIVVISNPQSLVMQRADIYDLTGRLVQSVNLTTMGTEKAIDISDLSTAAYMVILKGEQGQIVKRLLKE